MRWWLDKIELWDISTGIHYICACDGWVEEGGVPRIRLPMTPGQAVTSVVWPRSSQQQVFKQDMQQTQQDLPEVRTIMGPALILRGAVSPAESDAAEHMLLVSALLAVTGVTPSYPTPPKLPQLLYELYNGERREAAAHVTYAIGGTMLVRYDLAVPQRGSETVVWYRSPDGREFSFRVAGITDGQRLVAVSAAETTETLEG